MPDPDYWTSGDVERSWLTGDDATVAARSAPGGASGSISDVISDLGGRRETVLSEDDTYAAAEEVDKAYDVTDDRLPRVMNAMEGTTQMTDDLRAAMDWTYYDTAARYRFFYYIQAGAQMTDLELYESDDTGDYVYKMSFYVIDPSSGRRLAVFDGYYEPYLKMYKISHCTDL